MRERWQWRLTAYTRHEHFVVCATDGLVRNAKVASALVATSGAAVAHTWSKHRQAAQAHKHRVQPRNAPVLGG